MHSNEDLTALGTHFDFGSNWASFARAIDEKRVDEAREGLKALLGDIDLKGKRFLDIGCGSGIHAVAALQLGAAEVLAVDLDPQCVETTKAVLNRYVGGSRFRVERLSVFELDPADRGTFDVVYSWGVLHHTGNMRSALRKASAMIGDRGSFLFALYSRTLMCPAWRIEKKWYAGASKAGQAFARSVYTSLFTLRLWASGRSLSRYIEECSSNRRGMSFDHDVHDWLGGYPYESISSDDVESVMQESGLTCHKRVLCAGPTTRVVGLFGTGCDEYHYRRREIKSQDE